MSTRQSISDCRPAGWLGLPLALLLTGPALAADEEDQKAQVEQEYEVGAYVLDEDAWRFGKYTGLTDDGTELLLDFRLESRPEWNSGETRSWSLQGWRLGLDSRRLEFEYQNQGSWEFEAAYRETPNYLFADGVTPFSGAGSSLLELPAGWVGPAGGTTASFAALEDSLVPVSSYWQRKRLDLEYDRNIGRDWSFDISWRHETKEGDGAFGGVFGYDGLNPRAVVLPAPVDWETDIMEAAFDYGTQRYQLGFAAYASWFGNNDTALAWQNPYGARSTWAPAAGYPTGYGSAALAPDNHALRFRVYGGVNISPTTRLSGDVAFGEMEQDDTLLPYTVNPLLNVPAALPRASAEAKVRTFHANARFTMRPLKRLGVLANFTLDERDNRTPQAVWQYVGGDSENQKPYEEARINLPYSFRKKQFDLTGTWRAGGGTRVKAGAEWADYHRTYAEVLDSTETRLFAGIGFKAWSMASLSLDYAWVERDVDEYVGNRPYLAYRVPGSVDEDAFDNLPALRKYNQTDREREEFRLRADFFPSEKFNFGLAASRFDDDYNDPEGLFGLKAATVESWTLDAGLYPTDTLSLTGYYTEEEYDSYQTGRMWTNGITANNPANDWRADFADDVATWNLALELRGLGEDSGTGDRLRLGLDYTVSKVESEIRVTGERNILALPLPLLLTEMNSWSVYGRYRFSEKLGLKLSYEQQDLTSNDFALDDVPIDGSPSVLLMGQAAANYDVSLVMLSLSYRY